MHVVKMYDGSLYVDSVFDLLGTLRTLTLIRMSLIDLLQTVCLVVTELIDTVVTPTMTTTLLQTWVLRTGSIQQAPCVLVTEVTDVVSVGLHISTKVCWLMYLKQSSQQD